MSEPFSYEFPYTSQRMPVLAANCVATSQPLAAQAGLEMLRNGGNAIDAAVATAIALTVVEPTSNGIGADGFALIWSGGGLHGMNASGRSPAGFDLADHRGKDSLDLVGWDGVTTPGAPSGWKAAHEQFGALPFAELFAPAIRYAREGFLVSPQTAIYWERGARKYKGDVCRAWHETFAPGGEAPRAGDFVRLPDHGATLESIAQTGARSFYEGELADRIDGAAKAGGGALRKSDLVRHQARWVRPISIDYKGWRLHEIPPNGQGIVALIALGILRHLDVDRHPVDSPESLHLQIEAMKAAFADGHRYVADPAYMDVDPVALLDDAYLRSRARLIDPTRAQDFDHGAPKSGGTVLLSAADGEGNMVSFIQSCYTGFGSGVVVPGTGISLQNRGCCFTLEEGHPNQAGPSKLPYHTIIPGFVTRDGAGGEEAPVMAFGVMGGYMQPQGHAQVVVRMGDYAQNPQAALDAPRWQVESGLRVSIEPGYAPGVYEALESMGHDVIPTKHRTVSFGRGQIICKLDGGYIAASDLRADGQAVGF